MSANLLHACQQHLLNGRPLSPDALAYYEAQHYDRTESTRAECCMEAGWTIFGTLAFAIAFFCAQTGVFA